MEVAVDIFVLNKIPIEDKKNCQIFPILPQVYGKEVEYFNLKEDPLI